MDIFQRHSIQVNFLLNFFLKASNVLCSVVGYAVAYRVLGADNVGKVAFTISVTGFFGMLATLGIPTYGIRECARYRDDRRLLSKTVRELLLIQSVMTVVSAALLALAVSFVPKLREEPLLFGIEGVALLTGAIGTEWLYAGLERYGYIAVRTTAAKLLSLLLIVLTVRRRTDYLIYAGLLTLATVLAHILNLVSLHRFVDWKQADTRYEPQRHMRSILIFFAQTVAITIYTSLDSAMLGFLSDSYWVGLYDSAVKIKQILAYYTTSLGTVLFPRLAYYAHENDREAFWGKIVRSAEFTVITAVPLSVFVFCMSEEMISFLFGAEYLPAASALRVLSLTPVLIGGSTLLGTQILMTTGREKIATRAVFAGAGLDAALNFLLIPRYAAMGAALGTLAAEVAVFALEACALREHLAELIRKSVLWRTMLFSSVVVVLPLVIKLWIPVPAFWKLALGAFAYFGAVYGMLWYAKEPMIRLAVSKVCALFLREKI